MKERLREMSEWWNQVASEDDDEENLESENDPKVMILLINLLMIFCVNS